MGGKQAMRRNTDYDFIEEGIAVGVCHETGINCGG